MHNIWFERSIPSQYEPMLAGAAVAIGAGDLAGENPLHRIAEADGVIAGGLTYDGAMMDQAPRVLVITRVGIGYDKVDLDAATVRGIAICNTPDAPTISTAEMAITLMMAVARNLKMVEADLRDALQNGSPRREYIAFELYGKRLGLVGLGRIGGHVAKIASAMGMHVAAYDPYLSAERAVELGVEVVNSLEELLGMSDVVSLHLPLSPETHHTMNAERFAQMKQNAILINAARGGHVDEKALLDALDSGKLFGAGLDVTDPEPPLKDNPLLYRENVVLTPHIASATFAGKEKMFTKAIEQVLQVLRGERPPHLLNPEVWPQVVERINAR
jgi:D-3-phosphoglycerate dehydrogenase